MHLLDESISTIYETNLYRCLVYHEKQTEEIYLTLCGVEKCLPGYEFHCGDRGGYHLHVILFGRGILNVNGTEYPLHRGQMFVTKPGEKSYYRADDKDPWIYCWMTFDGIKAGKYVESTGMSQGINWRDCYADPQEYYSFVKEILDRPGMSLANDLQRLGMLLSFISLAIDTETRKQHLSRHENNISTDTYVDMAVTYIQSNFSNVKINDVARNIGINRSYLTKIFKQKVGVSPQEYLMERKLSYACKLLNETDAQIQDIARRVGYNNLLTFSKIFKSRYGISPKNFRLQKRSGKEKYL